MITLLEFNENQYKIDFNKPIDLSIPVGDVKCFNAPNLKMEPVKSDGFIGSVKEGSPVNFFNVTLNPHGNGTHTECLGHITEQQESINENLKTFHFIAKLISVETIEDKSSNNIITLDEIIKKTSENIPEALIIRTLPNPEAKLNKDYSNTNPAYFSNDAMKYLVEKGVKHLLVDLPSVDKENDKGLLTCHHIFWNINKSSPQSSNRLDCTITELIYAENNIEDGLYLLNLQIAPINLDAVPSKPVIYKMERC